MKATFSVLLALLAPALSIAQDANRNNCPQKVVLRDAEFINHQRFPTSGQIETQFKSRFQTGGFQTFMHADLVQGQNFVAALQSAYDANLEAVAFPITREVAPDGNVTCKGMFGRVPFAFRNDGLDFEISENERTLLRIGATLKTKGDRLVGDNVVVEFFLNLPSNCSGCERQAQLMAFDRIEVFFR